MIRVGISAEFINMKSGGPESYIVNLIKALMKIDQNEYNLYVVNDSVFGDRQIPHNFNICSLRFYNPWLRNALIMPLELFRRPIDILHIQNVVPPLYRGKLVATIHDISFEIYPETFPKAMRLRLSLLVKLTARRADVVITGSENTKKDLISLYGVPPENIEVTPYSHSDIYRQISDGEKIESIKTRYGLNERYVLYTGTLQPRKNVVGLIRAWNILRGNYHVKCKLVIVGKQGWLYTDIMRLMEESDYTKDIIYLGYLPDKVLPYIFNAAELYVYPSFYEGFGLTVLEAMACGVPVIAANNSSLPEVLGDAGILVDPHSDQEIAKAMFKVFNDQDLKTDMIKKGIERSKMFSWEHTAKRTLAVYNKIFED
jgi:glycosyltransferase involved in cell wall biosynthesis